MQKQVERKSVSHNIVLHSIDRNAQTYSNPFNYVVSFLGNQTTNNNNATISKHFRNVESITLQNVIVPLKNAIETINCLYVEGAGGDVNAFIGLYNAAVNTQLNTSFSNIVGTITFNNAEVVYFEYFKVDLNAVSYYIVIPVYYANSNLTSPISGTIGDTALNIVVATILGGGNVNNYALGVNRIIETNRWINVYINGNIIHFVKTSTTFNEILDDCFILTHNGIAVVSIVLNRLTERNVRNQKYMLLNVSEIDSAIDYSTDRASTSSFTLLIPEFFQNNNYYLNAHNYSKIFNGKLENINKMSIDLRDSNGDAYFINSSNILNINIATPKNCICTVNNSGLKQRNYTCAHSYILHPYYHELQNTIMLKINTIEYVINTIINTPS